MATMHATESTTKMKWTSLQKRMPFSVPYILNKPHQDLGT